MRVRLDTFGALSLRPQEDIAGANRATRARDVDLRRGKLHPLKSPSEEPESAPGAPHKTLHFFACGQGEWRTWAGHVPVARGPSDPWDRTDATRWYYAEGGVLKVLACVGGELVDRPAALSAPSGVPAVGVLPVFAPPALTLYYDGQASFDPADLIESPETAYAFSRQSVGCALESMEVDGSIATLRYRRPGFLRALNVREVGGGITKADVPAPNFAYVLKYGTDCSANAGDPFARSEGGGIANPALPNPNPDRLELQPAAAAAAFVPTVGTLYTVPPRERDEDGQFFPELPDGLSYPGQDTDPQEEGTVVVNAVGIVRPCLLEFKCRVAWAQPAERLVRYRFAYVDDIGQLSPGGAISAAVRVPPGHAAVVSNWTETGVGVPGSVEATELRLYRARWEGVTEADSVRWWRIGARFGSGFAEYDPAELADSQTAPGAFCDTTTGKIAHGGFWDLRGEDGFDAARDLAPEEGPPPSAITALVAHPGGFLAAIAAKADADAGDAFPVLRFSEVRHANHWPAKHAGVTVDRPVALEVSGNDLVVGTTGRPEVWFGSAPERLTGSRIPFDQPCVSARGMVAVGGLVCYPSPDGLCGIAGGTARVLTAEHFLPEQWKALGMRDVGAVAWEGRWLSTVSDSTGEGLVVDPATGDTVTHTVAATAFHYEFLTDAVWCVWGAEPESPGGTDRWVLGMWGRGAARELLWRSKLVLLPARAHWTAVRVRAQAYPARLALLFHRRRAWGGDDLDGDALDTAARCPLKAMDARPFRLPATVPPVDSFALEVRSSSAVVEVSCGTSPSELEG